jgi:hypothetical protein
MKIYTKIVIDMETLVVLETECFDYEGPVALCKGGSTTTTSVDYAYNARMATISERQQLMSEEYFTFWQNDYKPLEKAQIQANLNLIPTQTAEEKMKLEQSMELMPFQTELAKEGAVTGIKQQQQMRPVMEEFYKQALEGVDESEEMRKARADVGLSFAESQGALERQAGRFGLDPTSARFQKSLGDQSLEKSRITAGAMQQAREGAEEKTFQRRQTAVGMGLPR